MEQLIQQTIETYLATGDVTYLLFTLLLPWHLFYEDAADRTVYRRRITR